MPHTADESQLTHAPEMTPEEILRAKKDLKKEVQAEHDAERKAARAERLEAKHAREAAKLAEQKPRVKFRGKKYRAVSEKVDRMKVYPLAEALALAVATSTTKFDGTVELHLRTRTNPTKSDQQIRTTVSLPHGTGRKVRVAVFCEDDKVKAAEAAGATVAGSDDLIEKVAGGFLDFDVAVSTPGMMKSLAKVARVLGPKGLMPNPKTGTVTEDVAKAVAELAAGRIELRVDTGAIVHCGIGKVSFGAEKLLANAEAVLETLRSHKPHSVKGPLFKSGSVATTMGPGIRAAV